MGSVIGSVNLCGVNSVYNFIEAESGAGFIGDYYKHAYIFI